MPATTLRRLGVLDRGETAVRVLHAVGVLNSSDGADDITTVLFHDDREGQPWFGREADETVGLPDGAATHIDHVMEALQRAQIDTVWLGRWPTQDRAAFVDACESAGIGVAGPDGAAVRAMADAGRLDALARGAGFDETLLGPTRNRVVIDVVADDAGTVWTTGCRGVNVRLDQQVLIAEASCSSVDDALSVRIRSAVEALATALQVRGAIAVTVIHDGASFVLDDLDHVAAPDHATAEERTGVSFVGLRLRVQRGEALADSPPPEEGVAVEARILADGGSATPPASRIALLSFPVGTGVRIDANRRVGDVVERDDPLVAVITAWGPDRPIAIARLRRALERTSVVLDGCTTNRTLLLALLDHPELQAGSVDEGWLAKVLDTDMSPPADPVALLAAAVEAYEADRILAQQRFYLAAATGRPEQPEDVGGKIELSYRGEPYDVRVDHTGPGAYSIRHGSHVADVEVDRFDDFERRITCAGRRHRMLVNPIESAFHIELDGVAHVVSREDGVVVRAGWPALVVAALVEPGQHVTEGSPIAILESMKMETTVTAPFDGEVLAVAIAPNAQVDRGTPIVRIRPSTLAGGGAAHDGAPVDLSGLQHRTDFTRKPCDRVYGPLGDYLLGFDLAPQAMRRLLTEQRRLAEIADPADPALVACEDSLLDIYADLGALYRPVTESDPDAPGPNPENTQEYFVAFMQWIDADRAGLPENYRARLRAALGRYGIHDLRRTADLESTLMRLFRSFARLGELSPMVSAILQRRLAHRDALAPVIGADGRARLDRLAAATQGRQQHLAELARDVRFHYFDEPPMEAAAAEIRAEMADHLSKLASDIEPADREARIERLVWCPHPLRTLLLSTWRSAETFDDPLAVRRAVLDVHIGRFYRIRRFEVVDQAELGGFDVAWTDYDIDGTRVHLLVGYLAFADLPAWSAAVAEHLSSIPPDDELVIDIVAWRAGERPDIDDAASEFGALLERCEFGRQVHRIDVDISSSTAPADDRFRAQNLTFRQEPDGEFVEDELYRNLHPMLAKRLELWRLSNFRLERRPSPEDIYLFHGVAHGNPRDQRLFALAEVRDLNPAHDPDTGAVSYPRLERIGLQAAAAMRSELARYAAPDRPVANRIVLDVRAPWNLPPDDVSALAHRFAPLAAQVGLEKVVVKVRIPDEREPGGLRNAVLQFEGVGQTVLIHEERAGDQPVRSLTRYQQKVLTSARFGSPYPYEIVRLLTAGGDLPVGTFVELDLDDDGDGDQLVPVDREPGNNAAHIVVGLLTNHTEVVPEGMQRVVLLSDPTQGLGNLAEPECRRVNAALAYAQAHHVPVEWFAVSSGALISMESGTENMDWIALTLRRLIEYTQAGGEVNIIVTGINVGGQPYWNAEATMLMHTKGILVMTPASTMVLTGKQALDFSGAVSAEDNFGIGGYDRVMGPNGQAQYWAPSFPAACALLIRHYELTYVVPGERFPRRRPTDDPFGRDVRDSEHAAVDGSPFETVGDVFSAELNPERKQPFDMRSVMRSVADVDCEPLERWQHLRDGDTSIVWDTTVGGIPVCLLGLESHTVARKGFVPADGPPAWTSGTLFPHSSRKTARAINAASGSRPLVVLANLSGFDGSPESMRRRQLEFGAEIGRAVTNFVGPIVFVVVSRYHGGAFVVFSKALNESMEIAAVEGAYASVIGGAPAAATVFAREVKQRTERDDRVREAREALEAASGPTATDLRISLAEVSARVRSEKLTEVADEFDAIHTIERALRVGSVDRIIAAADLRPYVIDALERGMARLAGRS
jgi:acetyl/propionyl-CoA carboxylase alpha subunit/acetyl-CoA carboxylase carboxyltransferase component